jgi:hypothetical protein
MCLASRATRVSDKILKGAIAGIQSNNVPEYSLMGQNPDVTLSNFDVCFTPESGHPTRHSECLLWAKSRHCVLGAQLASKQQVPPNIICIKFHFQN